MEEDEEFIDVALIDKYLFIYLKEGIPLIIAKEATISALAQIRNYDKESIRDYLNADLLTIENLESEIDTDYNIH